MKDKKKSASDKRLEAFNDAAMELILFTGYESRVAISELIKDLKPVKLISGRKCVGTKKTVNKITNKPELKKVYKITRRFIEFENKSRLSVGTEIFSYLKIDHKTPHSFEFYDGLVNSKVKIKAVKTLF